MIAFTPNQVVLLFADAGARREQGNTLHYLIEDEQIAYLTAADVMNVSAAAGHGKVRAGMVAFGDPTGADLPNALQRIQ